MVLAKYLSAEILKKTAKDVPCKIQQKRTCLQARIGQKDSKSAYIHGVCLLNHGYTGLIWKAA